MPDVSSPSGSGTYFEPAFPAATDYTLAQQLVGPLLTAAQNGTLAFDLYSANGAAIPPVPGGDTGFLAIQEDGPLTAPVTVPSGYSFTAIETYNFANITGNGGAGDVTIQGGVGGGLFQGGSAGNNSITGGAGKATIFGGGSGDTLAAGGSLGDALVAASGNETLTSASSRGLDSMYGGSGSDAMIAGLGGDLMDGRSGAANFEFTKGMTRASSTYNVFNDHPGDAVTLSGYGSAPGVASAGGNTVLSLSDGTKIPFVRVASGSDINIQTS